MHKSRNLIIYSTSAKIILLLKNHINGSAINPDCCQMLKFVGIKTLSDSNNI